MTTIMYIIYHCQGLHSSLSYSCKILASCLIICSNEDISWVADANEAGVRLAPVLRGGPAPRAVWAREGRAGVAGL